MFELWSLCPTDLTFLKGDALHKPSFLTALLPINRGLGHRF